jgi:hypothetical protein
MIEPYTYKIVERIVSLIDGDDKTIMLINSTAEEEKKSLDSVDHLNKKRKHMSVLIRATQHIPPQVFMSNI